MQVLWRPLAFSGGKPFYEHVFFFAGADTIFRSNGDEGKEEKIGRLTNQ